jgi:hypothetical protein
VPSHGVLRECREPGPNHLLHLPEIQPGMETPHPLRIYTSTLTSLFDGSSWHKVFTSSILHWTNVYVGNRIKSFFRRDLVRAHTSYPLLLPSSFVLPSIVENTEPDPSNDRPVWIQSVGVARRRKTCATPSSDHDTPPEARSVPFTKSPASFAWYANESHE